MPSCVLRTTSGAIAITAPRSSGRINTPTAVALIAVGSIALAGCGGSGGSGSAPEAGSGSASSARATLTVTARPARLAPLPRTIQAPGTVAAWQEVPVGAETGGLTAVRVYVDEGSVVRQGQVLVKLNDALLRAQLRQQDAQLASSRATLAQAEADFRRAEDLARRGFLSPASLDARRAQQATAAASVAAAQAGRAETLTRLSQTEVRAPVSGLITARTVVLGQIVGAGSELFRLVRQGQLELNAQVPETDLQGLRAGLPVRVTLAEIGDMQGTIRIVTPQIDPQTRLGVARISLPPRLGVRPGMFGTAEIALVAAPTVVVPQSAIVYRGSNSGVFVLDAGNHARFRAVQTGARLGREVAVTGVREGERVVDSGAGFLGDGDLVTVAAAAPPAAAPATPAASARPAGGAPRS